jgi:hypothetical protein
MCESNVAADQPNASEEQTGALRAASDIVDRNLGETAVLIRLQTKKIYELNATGARIWDLLKAGFTKERVVDALVSEFNTNRDALSEAVDELVDTLRAEGLIHQP